MSNVFTPYFQRVDDLFPKFESDALDEAERAELAELFRRAIFYLANHLNYMASITPHLILDPEPDVVEGEAESAPGDASDPSLEQPQDA